MKPAPLHGESLERFDRNVLQSALDGRHLPPFVPGEPSQMGAAEGAGRVIPILLDAIQDAHAVEQWTPEAFEDVFVGGALRAWHGDLETQRGHGTFTVRSATCPVFAQATKDARVCQMCRATTTMAAQASYGWKLRGITFPYLLTQGDAVCEMCVALAGP